MAFIFLFLGILLKSYSFYKLDGVYRLTEDTIIDQDIVIKQNNKYDDHNILVGNSLALMCLDTHTGIALFADLRIHDIEVLELESDLKQLSKQTKEYKTVHSQIERIKTAYSYRNNFFFLPQDEYFSYEHLYSTSFYKLKVSCLPNIKIDQTKVINPITPTDFNHLLDDPKAENIRITIDTELINNSYSKSQNTTIKQDIHLSLRDKITNIIKIKDREMHPTNVTIALSTSKDSGNILLKDFLLVHCNNNQSRMLLEKSEILTVYHVLGNQKMIGLAVNNETKELFHWCTNLGKNIVYYLFHSVPKGFQDIDIKFN